MLPVPAVLLGYLTSMMDLVASTRTPDWIKTENAVLKALICVVFVGEKVL